MNKADKACDTNQPINDSRVDKTEQECDQLDKWTIVVRKKRWCHKSGNAPDATFKTVEIFVSRLKPDTRIVYLKKMVLGQVPECKKCAVSSIENQI